MTKEIDYEVVVASEVVPSLEGFFSFLNDDKESSFIKKINNAFINKTQLFTELFNGNKKGVFKKKDYNIFLKDLVDMEKKLNQMKEDGFSKYANYRVPYIPGLRYNLPDTMSKINLIIPKLNNTVEDMLDELDTKLANFITGKSTKSRRPATRGYKWLRVELDEVMDDIIDHNKYDDSFKLKEITHNISSLNEVRYSILSLAKILNTDKLKVYDELSTEIANKVDFLIDVYKKGDNDITKNSVVDLSIELEDAAYIITNLSSIVYLTHQFTTILKKIVELRG